MSRRQRRKQDIRRRIAGPQDAYDQCRVVGCSQPTTAIRQKGLHRLYCRRHKDHFGRHGSYFTPSLRASDLRAEAQIWITSHGDDLRLREALRDVSKLYSRAGPPIEAFRLAGKLPATRAAAVWAALRERQVSAATIVEIVLAVSRRIDIDPQADRHKEYLDVQVAKLLHRLAGGTHKSWRQQVGGREQTLELHKHPNSRGRVLRLVGAQACAAVHAITPSRVWEFEVRSK